MMNNKKKNKTNNSRISLYFFGEETNIGWLSRIASVFALKGVVRDVRFCGGVKRNWGFQQASTDVMNEA